MGQFDEDGVRCWYWRLPAISGMDSYAYVFELPGGYGKGWGDQAPPLDAAFRVDGEGGS